MHPARAQPVLKSWRGARALCVESDRRKVESSGKNKEQDREGGLCPALTCRGRGRTLRSTNCNPGAKPRDKSLGRSLADNCKIYRAVLRARNWVNKPNTSFQPLGLLTLFSLAAPPTPKGRSNPSKPKLPQHRAWPPQLRPGSAAYKVPGYARFRRHLLNSDRNERSRCPSRRTRSCHGKLHCFPASDRRSARRPHLPRRRN